MATNPQHHAHAVIRTARPSDCPAIFGLVRELAEYERLTHAVVANDSMLRNTLFPPDGGTPLVHALVAESGGTAVGFALYFFNYSSFLGRLGLYLEDLYVRPARRGMGIGKALLVELAKAARARGCGRMEWSVLDWNSPAIDFYKALGARPMDEWTVYRLDTAGIAMLADGAG
jgi:GNAT superfamily N-acetyltransferase